MVRFKNPFTDAWFGLIQPYFFPSRIDGGTAFYWAYANEVPYINNPVTLTANQVIRVGGMCIAQDT